MRVMFKIEQVNETIFNREISGLKETDVLLMCDVKDSNERDE